MEIIALTIIDTLRTLQGIDVDTICGEYENGTSLHIAAANLSVEAARILLSFGADKDLLDDLARKPVDCVPDPEDFDLIPDAPDLIVKMRKLLNIRNGEILDGGGENGGSRLDLGSVAGVGAVAVSGRTALKAMGLKGPIIYDVRNCLYLYLTPPALAALENSRNLYP